MDGLILAEAEFDSPAESDALLLPSFPAREVSTDIRLTGGHLVRASRHDVQTWLSDYDISLEQGFTGRR